MMRIKMIIGMRLCLIFMLAAFAFSDAQAALKKKGGGGGAFYVATTGNDSNPGTLAQPFATLPRAQAAMQASSTKTTYIRAGSYAPAAVSSNCGGNGFNCALDLGSADTGEQWSYYPPDGVNSADFTGGSTAKGNGLFVLIDADNTTNVTINGLSLHNFQFAAVASIGGASGLVVENNLVFNGYYFGGPDNNAAGIMCYGCATSTVSHNVIHDIADFGISWSNVNGNISGLLITGNVLYNTCTSSSDCGSIYIQDGSATATNMQITNNFVRDGNTFATLSSGGGGGSAVYLDDCTSNATVTGNVLTGRNGANTSHIHGGNNDIFLRNMIDLTSYAQAIIIFQTSDGTGCSAGTMSGNEYENNVVIGEGGGGGYYILSGSPVDSPTITNNDYYNYGGSSISSGGSYTDSNPSSQDPQISGCYVVAPGSPVLGSPVNFSILTAGWGPPGYVIPNSGTLPSYPSPTC
jgi:hypothetical protein